MIHKCKIIIFTILMLTLYSQNNVGIRGDIEFSSYEETNPSLGIGGYLIINNFSKKIELLFSGDYNRANRIFPNEQDGGYEMEYKHISFIIAGMYSLNINNKLKLKTGPGIGYSITNADYTGLWWNWTTSYNPRHTGLTWVNNIKFYKLFALPVNLDMFISPTYLLLIKGSDSNSGFVKSDYNKNLKMLNIQIGVSYNVE